MIDIRKDHQNVVKKFLGVLFEKKISWKRSVSIWTLPKSEILNRLRGAFLGLFSKNLPMASLDVCLSLSKQFYIKAIHQCIIFADFYSRWLELAQIRHLTWISGVLIGFSYEGWFHAYWHSNCGMACPMDPQLSRLVSSRGDPPSLDMGLTIDRGMPINSIWHEDPGDGVWYHQQWWRKMQKKKEFSEKNLLLHISTTGALWNIQCFACEIGIQISRKVVCSCGLWLMSRCRCKNGLGESFSK